MSRANDRFKRGFDVRFWRSLILATLLHAGVFSASPRFGLDDYRITRTELTGVELPDVIEIPPPPDAIPRPPTPVFADVTLDDFTIPPTTFSEYRFEPLPPPPSRDRDLAAAPAFTPMTVRPRLRNELAIQRALMENYPPLLKQAGIGGTVNVWFFIGPDGRVLRTQINRSSGHDAFDEAALMVAALMEFTPAYDRDLPIHAWVTFDIRFENR